MKYFRMLKKLPGFFAPLILCVLTACSPDSSAEARAVIERTKKTRSTYSVYIRNHVTMPGDRVIKEWSAEFHLGDKHRVETPRDRVVADCLKRIGYHLSLTTGETTEGPRVVASACGIDTIPRLASIELLPNVRTKFGTAQRVRVVDDMHVRQYDVLANGALARTSYTENRWQGVELVVAEALRLEPDLPDKDMFSKASLNKSFLPQDPIP
jgi:hypothetical protein